MQSFKPAFQQKWRSDATGKTETVSIYPVQDSQADNELFDEIVGGSIDYVVEKTIGKIIENESD